MGKYIIWGIFALLLIGIILLNRHVNKNLSRTYKALSDRGLTTDHRVGQFAVDSRRHKWMILRKNELHVHDYSDLERAELWENDAVYHLQEQAFVTEDGAVFSPEAAIQDPESRAITRLELHIFSSHAEYPEEVIPLIKGTIQSRSGLFFSTAHTACNIARLISAIWEWNRPSEEISAEEETEYVFDDSGKLIQQKKSPDPIPSQSESEPQPESQPEPTETENEDNA